MPRVPALSGPQGLTSVTPGAYQQPVDVSRDARQLAGGLASAAGALDAYQERQDQDAAFATDAKLKSDWLDFETKLRESRKGRDAASIDTEAAQWWQDAASKYAADLSPRARRLVNRSLTTSQLQAMSGIKSYKEQQLNASADASYRAAQAVSVNEAATVGTEAAALKAIADMDQKRAERAALQGWTPEQAKADSLSWTGTLHGIMVQKLMRQDPAAAQVYFDKYRGNIGAEQAAALEGQLAQTSAALDGSAAAGKIWAALGPKADGQPVEIDKMEEAARKQYAGDPVRQKMAIAEVQARAAAHNAAERERTAGRVNTVMDAYAKGAPLSRLQSMPDFMALPGAERAKIQEHITDRNHMLMARSVEDRARMERELQQKAFPQFLDYSDPDKLATMSRQQVQALLPQLGNDLTGHLVQKWDALQKPQAKLEARIDTEDFNHVADQMGLRPYDPTKTEPQRQQLGELKFRLEQLIDGAQAAKKAPLTREEKRTMFEQEMARTVAVNGWFSSTPTPVIQLKAEDISKVVVPEADRGQIAQALATMYKQTGSPLYAPTEQNMRRLYLMNKSRAAALLPPEK